MAESAKGPWPPGPLVGSPRALAVTLLVALASLLPIGFFADDAGVATHFALGPLYAASIRPNARIGPVGAFAAGLLVDVLTLAPLGVCAISYLMFHGIAAREAPVLYGLPASGRMGFFAPLALAVVAIHVVTMVALDGSEPTRVEIAISVAATLVSYPVVLVVARIGRGTVPRWRLRTTAIRS